MKRYKNHINLFIRGLLAAAIMLTIMVKQVDAQYRFKLFKNSVYNILHRLNDTTQSDLEVETILPRENPYTTVKSDPVTKDPLIVVNINPVAMNNSSPDVNNINERNTPLYSKDDKTVKSGYYRVIRIDSVVFAQHYLILLQNPDGDTLFVLSQRVSKNQLTSASEYGEQLKLNEIYPIKFSSENTRFGEKLGYRYRRIEHLEIKYGDIIFWEDQLIQVPIHYSEQLTGLHFNKYTSGELPISADKRN